jgi:uncharacterized membrane protein
MVMAASRIRSPQRTPEARPPVTLRATARQELRLDTHALAHRQVERLLLFCDAVFAIAITLLVLEIKVPELHHPTEEALRQALVDLLPKIIGYVVSFLVVGSYWARHHQLFTWVAGWDDRLLWAHLRLLLCVAFIPFTTAFFSDYLASQTALVLYATSLGLLGLASYAVGRRLMTAPGLLAANAPLARVRLICRATLIAPLFCVVAMALAVVNLTAARACLCLLPVAVLLVNRRIQRL